MVQRDEPGERKAMEGRELFLQRKDREREGQAGTLGKYRKSTAPKSS